MKITTGRVYTSFKYAVYALLLINTFYFFEINSAAESATFANGVSFADLIVAYADGIDSLAWLLLLLVFEIETSYEPSERHRHWVAPLIGAATVLLWAIIVYAFYGYVGGLDMVRGFTVYAGAQPCSLAGSGAQFAVTLDDYIALDAENCRQLVSGVQYNADLDMFATPENLALISRLNWTDVVNAGTWIVLGLLIEFDIFLRVTHRATPERLRVLHLVQFPLWTVLVVAVLYWWALGDPIEAWDAFLWIACFFFIELNMMAKHEENARRRAKEENA